MLEFEMLGINGSMQDEKSGNTSLIVGDGEVHILVDASCHIERAVAVAVDAVVLTHEHIDHLYGLLSLLHQLWLGGRTKELDIICTPIVQEKVEGMLSLFQFRQKPHLFPIYLVQAASHQQGMLSFSAFKTDHTEGSIGLVFSCDGKKLVYTCDTRPILHPAALMENPDVLIHEASGTSQDEEMLVKKGHSSGLDAARLANLVHARHLYLCHLPQGPEQQARVLADARSLRPEAEIPPLCKPIALSSTVLEPLRGKMDEGGKSMGDISFG